MQPVIVGIDPGTTTAFASLSFDFKLLKVESKKNYSLAKLITDIYKTGTPIIVGTDKKYVPKLIKEFSQKTGAVIHKTKYDTKKGEKKHVVKEKKLHDYVKNTHETDALASAIYAYLDYKSLITKVEKFVKKKNKADIKDKILIEVIVNEKSLAKAVSDIEKKPKKKITRLKIKPVVEEKEPTKEQKEIKLLNNLVKKLRKQMKQLEEENKKLKQKRIDIDKETKKIISFKEKRALTLEKEINVMRKEIESKNKTIDKLNTIIVKTKGSILIKKLKNLGSEEFKKKNKITKIERDDVLLVENISITSNQIINRIKDMVKVIIYDKGTNKLLSDQFILIKKKNLNLLEHKFFALADKKQLEKERDKTIITRKKDTQFIKEILEEYKRERLKDIV